MRAIRLRLSASLYRLAWRIDPGDDPTAPKCLDCGAMLNSLGECDICADRQEREDILREEYDRGQRDAWRDAEHELGVAP